jgi:ribonuclease HI
MKKIYTDGACKNNPGKGGWAFIILEGGDKKIDEGVGSKELSTNNQMEMQAVIEGLKKTEPGETLGVYSDSAYVVNCFKNDWISGWKKKGWKNSQRKPVKNKELWEEMDALVSARNIEFFKVPAHLDTDHPDYDPFNDAVDKLADNAARNA